MGPSFKSVSTLEKNYDHVGENPIRQFPLELERKAIRRVDLRMLPLLGLLYAVSLIDRSNLGIARIAGMEKDLKLYIGARYSIVSSVYFISYIILQLPSNITLRILGARMWITICIVGWGAAQLGMGFVSSWGYLALTRVLLGAFEAGFFPALVFIITTWYKRYEVQKRLAFFYLFAMFITAFNSIFAYALTLLHGKCGLGGWQWIFVIEGIITIVLGIVTCFLIPDFPHKNMFLSPEQTNLVIARIEADRGDSIPDNMTVAKVLHHLSNWTLWAFALMFMCSTMPVYATGYFILIILASMGWGVRDSLLLTAPPSVFGAICCFIFAWISDRTRKRALLIAIQTVLTIIGLLITVYAKPHGVRYFGLFLVKGGASACLPAVLAYNANNVTTHTKRTVSTAVITSFGGVGGILATTVRCLA